MDRLEAHRAQKEAVRDRTSETTINADHDVSRYLLADAMLSGRREPAQPEKDVEETTAILERPQPLVVAGLDDSAGGYLAVEQAAREAAWRTPSATSGRTAA